MPDSRSPSLSNGSQPLHVLKFGGSSVGSPEGLERVVDIVTEATANAQVTVVVSAAAGVTDDLVNAAQETRHEPGRAEAWTEQVGQRYRSLARATLPEEGQRTRYQAILQAHLAELHRALRAMGGPEAEVARDVVLATGERLMVPLLVAAFEAAGYEAHAVDATTLIRTDGSDGTPSVDHQETRRQIRSWHRRQPGTRIPVITGFIGSTPDGNTATLGRGGSDYSAALLARALNAARLERWTDVNGLYSKDPRTYDEAEPLRHLTFEQARTWTKNGRLGLHPRMLEPLTGTQTTVHVRCTYAPEAPGTRIVPRNASTPQYC